MSGTNRDLENRKVRFRLISPLGDPSGTFDTAQEAAHAAGTYWPGMAQRDHDNGAAGWDIEAVR